MAALLKDLRSPNPDLFVISHSGARAGAPMVMLHLLRWLERETDLDVRTILLHGGAMQEEFEDLGARVLGGAGSRLWMIQRGLTNLGLQRPAAALAMSRLGPTMWANRSASLILLNSVGSLPALQFLPEDAPGKIVLFVHELDQSFERTIGPRVWEKLAPRVDHFITCADAVTELLVSRKGIDPTKVSCHRGFIEAPQVEPLRASYVKRSLGIPPDATVIGAVGRPDWRKAPELFIRLARDVHRRRRDLDLHFVWLGGPTDTAEGWYMVHDFEAAGLHGRFHLPGEVVRPEEVMALFDVFVLTSREDSYPLAMVEAAALGVPIVSFDNGGVRELASAGGDRPLAKVVPYLDVDAMVDATLNLLEDPDARADQAERAREHILSTHLTHQAAPRLLDCLADLEPGLAVRRIDRTARSA